MYCSMLSKTFKKCYSFGVAESHILGQNVRKLAKNRGKLENLIFYMIFLCQTNVKECIMYSSIPCLTYQTFKSKEVAKPYILGQNMRKIEVKSRKIEKSHSLYNFLSKWRIINASCTVQCFVWHINTVGQ